MGLGAACVAPRPRPVDIRACCPCSSRSGKVAHGRPHADAVRRRCDPLRTGGGRVRRARRAVSAGGNDPRRQPRLHRRLGGHRGLARDPDRSRCLASRGAMDRQRLHADAERLDPDRRCRGRPVRPEARLRAGRDAVRRRVRGVRAGTELRRAARGAGCPGHRWCAHGALQPCDHQRRLPGGRARPCDRNVGGIFGTHDGAGTGGRRLAGRCLVVAGALLPPSPPRPACAGAGPFAGARRCRGEKDGAIDWAGGALARAGLGALAYGLTEASDVGWRDTMVLLALFAGVAILGLFVSWQAHTRSPMMQLRLFRSPAFSGPNAITLPLYFALSAAMFFVPFNLIKIQGYSAALAGAAFLPFTLIMGGLSRWSGGLIARYGARPPLIVGPVIAALGFALFALAGIGGSYWVTVFPPMAVIAAGLALLSAVCAALTIGPTARRQKSG